MLRFWEEDGLHFCPNPRSCVYEHIEEVGGTREWSVSPQYEDRLGELPEVLQVVPEECWSFRECIRASFVWIGFCAFVALVVYGYYNA